MINGLGAPENFVTTLEIVNLTQPPEVRRLLVEEIGQMNDEIKALDNIKPSYNFTALGISFGSLGGILTAVVSRANPAFWGLAAGGGSMIGLTAGAFLDHTVGVSYNRFKQNVVNMRQQNFAKRVWSALPSNEQQTIRAALPPVKK